MDKNSMACTIYIIHAIANEKGLTPREVYRLLKNSGCIDEYLVPSYDVLHTLGTEYLINDVWDYAVARGAEL